MVQRYHRSKLPSISRFTVVAALVSSLALATAAEAADVQVEGSYRARGRAFQSLSLDSDHPNAEGLAKFMQHRLWVRPRFIVDDKIVVYADIRALDGVLWGDDPNARTEQVGDSGVVSSSDNDDLSLLDQALRTDDGVPAGTANIQLWRAWGEFHTDIGTFKFGRMPLHWGLGAWQNDGLGMQSDYGDTADRVQWENEFDRIFLRAAIDMNAEGLINQNDNTTSYNVGLAYRNEQVEAGINAQLRHTPNIAGDAGFTLGTVSLAAKAEMGNLSVGTEIIGQLGGGALSEDVNDVKLQAVGAVLEGAMDTGKLTLNATAGLATGDNTNDDKITTFRFDRDYNLGMFMFEQPMPLLDTADPRLTHAASGNGISNAIFAKVGGSYELPFDLRADAGAIAAWTFADPSLSGQRGAYGYEVNAGITWHGHKNIDLGGQAGLFLPGSFYRNLRDDVITDSLAANAFGGQATARIRF